MFCNYSGTGRSFSFKSKADILPAVPAGVWRWFEAERTSVCQRRAPPAGCWCRLTAEVPSSGGPPSSHLWACAGPSPVADRWCTPSRYLSQQILTELFVNKHKITWNFDQQNWSDKCRIIRFHLTEYPNTYLYIFDNSSHWNMVCRLSEWTKWVKILSECLPNI